MRHEHLFQFKACDIAAAAKSEAEYHRSRQTNWQDKLKIAVQRVKETATLKIEETPVTGGTRLHIGVNVGDPIAHEQMGLCHGKLSSHIATAEKLEVAARLYGSQGERIYDLDANDVAFFRLGGEPREE